MTNDNQDALRCADRIWPDPAGNHIRRLVRKNEFLSRALANRNTKVIEAAQQLNAKDALLRQAVEALDDLSTYDSRPSSIWRYFYPSATGDYVNLREVKEKIDPAIAAIRQHLDQKTT